MVLNVNANAVLRYNRILENMHRSGIPNAIRATLNAAAFDVKTNTMPAEADKEFTNRAPNFFKANSAVQMAKGWKISEMVAVVGFSGRPGRGADKAVQDLEQQEYGGRIQSRSFVPMDTARSSGNTSMVRPANRLTRIKNVINANNMAGANERAKFQRAVRKAGRGGYVLGNLGKPVLWRIDRISGRDVKKTPVYSYERGRSVGVSATGFMRTASIQSAHKMYAIYAREAQKQIERLRK